MLPLRTLLCAVAAFALPVTSLDFATVPAWAQDVAAATTEAATPDDAAPSALTEDELEVLVARIALYPDDLVALISSASLYPLQIVEAERYLEEVKNKPDETPKDSWDGSVISLLNYPDLVKMMSDDLEWTQDLGTALAYQQKDVLLAIQQLRDEAVAENVIKSDDKMTVIHEGDNVVIQSASPDKVYIPQYPPEMLYEPDYDVVPVSYYPDPYPYYYDPVAPYFAGFVTGAVWGAAMDWDHGGVWGGDIGDDIDINCRDCFNNINGKVRIGDVDWKNVDRSKVSFDRDQFTGGNHNEIRNSIKANDRNNIRTKAADIKRGDQTKVRTAAKAKDVRTDHHKANIAADAGKKRPAANAGDRKPGGDIARAGTANPKAKAATATKHKAAKPKAAARSDGRSKKPSALGEVKSGKHAKVQSSRGHKSMGGSGKPHKSVSRGGGGRHAGGGGGGHRGGGGGRHR